MKRSQSRQRFLIALAALAAVVPAVRAGDSFAESVPADVNLFVELRRNADLLLPLADAHVWSTLAELAGQPASADDAAEWRRRVNHTLLMEPEEAIKLLFSRGVAFVSGTPTNPREASLLCRLDEKTSLLELATRWQAQPLPLAEKATVYQLRNGIGLGSFDGLMIFGDASRDGKLFASLLRFSGNERPLPLAEDPTYRRLLGRVPENPDGVLFARLKPPPRQPTAPATQPATTETQPTAPQSAPAVDENAAAGDTTARPTPAPGSLHAGLSANSRRAGGAGPVVSELPGPLRGASNILLALHRRGNLLHYSAVGDAAIGDRPDERGDTPADVARLVESLPERTLLAWGAQIDYEALLRAANELPTQNLLRLAVGTQAAVLERLTAALDSSACIALGVVPPGEPDATPALPAVALVVRTRDAATAETEVTNFLHSLVSIYNLLSIRAKLPQLQAATAESIGGVNAHTIDLTPLVEPYVGTAAGPIRLAWARDGDVLVLASHTDWLRQIIEARHGRAADLSRVVRLTQRPVASRSETVIVVQSGPIGDLCTDWLAYLEARQPEVLREQWWRGRQPAGPRLGVNVAELANTKRLQILSLDRGSPAEAALRVGDQIVGCEGKRFATSQPVVELRDAIPQRKQPRKFELLVERAGVMTPVSLTVPFVDPIALLRRIAALGGISQRVVYHDDIPDREGARGFLTVELRSSKARLFSLTSDAQPMPASADGK